MNKGVIARRGLDKILEFIGHVECGSALKLAFYHVRFSCHQRPKNGIRRSPPQSNETSDFVDEQSTQTGAKGVVRRPSMFERTSSKILSARFRR